MLNNLTTNNDKYPSIQWRKVLDVLWRRGGIDPGLQRSPGSHQASGAQPSGTSAQQYNIIALQNSIFPVPAPCDGGRQVSKNLNEAQKPYMV